MRKFHLRHLRRASPNLAAASTSRNPKWLHGQGQFWLLPQMHSCGRQKFADCVANPNFLFPISGHNPYWGYLSHLIDPSDHKTFFEICFGPLKDCEEVNTDSFSSALTNTKGRRKCCKCGHFASWFLPSLHLLRQTPASHFFLFMIFLISIFFILI